MKYIITIIILVGLLTTTFAQQSEVLFDTTHVKLGLKKKEFAAWAKSIGKWNDRNVRPNGTRDTTEWTHSYNLDYSRKINYTYYFKEGEVSYIKVQTAIPPDFKERMMAMGFSLIETKKSEAKTTYVYNQSTGTYRLLLVERTHNTGWEEVKQYVIQIDKGQF